MTSARPVPIGARRRNAVALALALILAGLFASQGHLPWLQNLEAETVRWRYLARGPVQPGPETVLLEVDEATLAALGRWPVPRDRLAEAVAWLDQAGASAIVFDLLFLERQSPYGEAVAQRLERLRQRLEPSDPEAARFIADLLESSRPDRAFRTAIAQAKTVVLPFAFEFAPQPGAPSTPHAVRQNAYRSYVRPAGGGGQAPRALAINAPPQELAQAAAGLGHVNVFLAGDGGLRHAPAVITFAEDHYPALSVEALRIHLGLPRDAVSLRFGERLELGGLSVPLDAGSRIGVNYLGPAGSFPRHSLAAVLSGEAAAESFEGRIVLIGGRAAGTGETFATPYTQNLPSAEFHATVIDNMLHGRALKGGAGVQAVDIAAIALGGLAAGLLAGVLPMSGALLLGLALIAGWAAAAYLAFVQAGWMLSGAAPVLSVLAGLTWARAARAVDERARRRRFERERRNLSRYFSPQIAEALAGRDEPYSLEREQMAAVMFVDIRGFTAKAEGLPPEEAIALLRRFHARVEETVFAQGGTLDKYLGDGAMATFGVPEERSDDALAALRAAYRLCEAMAAESEGAPLEIGVGLHHGPVLMGNVGAERRLEFTVVGDTVNVASRLEALSKECGVRVVASEALIARARAAADESGNGAAEEDRRLLAAFRRLPERQLRGRQESMELWALD